MPYQSQRQRDPFLKELQKLPNVGPAIAADLVLIGITRVDQLKGRDSDALYHLLCERTGERQDPCVRDVFESIVSFANGNPAQPWWNFTAGRKIRDANKRLEEVHR